LRKRIIVHMSGFFLISFGIVGIIMSKLGAAPIDAFNYFMYVLTPLSLGTWAIITGVFAAVVSFIIDRKKNILISVALLFMIGALIDLWKYLFELLPLSLLESYAFRVPLALFSLIIVSFGVALTLITGLPSSPFERLLLSFNRWIKNLTLTKIMIEGTFLVLAIILGLVTGELLTQVHIFTVVLTFSIGPLVSLFMRWLNQKKLTKGEIIYAT